MKGTLSGRVALAAGGSRGICRGWGKLSSVTEVTPECAVNNQPFRPHQEVPIMPFSKIAILGASGSLGPHILAALLDTFPGQRFR